MLREKRKFSVSFIVAFLFLSVIYGTTYSIKSDSMIIYTAGGENRTKFFSNVKFETDSINFTSKFAEMFGDTMLFLSDSVVGKSGNNRYKTDKIYFYPNESIAKFIGHNCFTVSGNVLKGDTFLLHMVDSVMNMRGNLLFVSRNDSFAVNAGAGSIDNGNNIAIFQNNPELEIRGDSDTVHIKSDTIVFEGDSLARFKNNLSIAFKGGTVEGKEGVYFKGKNKGIVTGAPCYTSKEASIKGDTMKFFTGKIESRILFYNNAEMQYNKKDSVHVESDTVEIDLANDSIKTIKAFGEVDGSYESSER